MRDLPANAYDCSASIRDGSSRRILEGTGMDIPVFHLDYLNNRMIIAIIAIAHVVINHAMAVGGIPLVTFLERKGLRTGNPEWDALAFRIMTVFFIITTTLGALTGVGIWISTSLVNPYAIGSLLRVFFWTWFVEWLIFFTEVVLIMAYYLSWKKLSGPHKALHVKLGWALSIASWITMVLIVSILSFMMDPGSWLSDRTLFSGMLNPLYLPQLAFRTTLAMIMAGATVYFLIPFFAARQSAIREDSVRLVSLWILFWLPFWALAGFWYAKAIPAHMVGNLPVALMTQALSGWSSAAQYALAAAAGGIGTVAAWGAFRPRKSPWPVLWVPALLSLFLMAHFERVREFIRKPYAISGYLYSNGLRKDEYPLLQRDGILKHATYANIRAITPENKVEAGREIFLLTCTRCHTVNGENGIRSTLYQLYGNKIWEEATISEYLGVIHNIRPFMPPFPGTVEERDALAAYLKSLKFKRDILEGAQTTGAPDFRS